MTEAGRPLLGRTVLVTRPDSEWTGLQERLRALGASPVFVASIRQVAPADGGRVELALANLGRYQWILFTSPAGVRFFDDAARRRGLSAESLFAAIAAVGEGTARALSSLGYRAEVVATAPHGRGLGAAVAERIEPGGRALWVRPEIAAPGLGEDLAAVGIEVDSVAFYATVASERAAEVAADLVRGRFDAVVWTSPSSFERVLDAAGPGRERLLAALAAVRSVALGPTTAAALTRAGVAVAEIAADPSEAELERLLLRTLAS